MRRSHSFVGLLTAVLVSCLAGTALAQALPDCFDGLCGGSKGIPQCPQGFKEVGFVTYANHHANQTKDCVTAVSCTNFNESTVELSCRFYHGFNPIPKGGGPRDALCSVKVNVGVGDTSECATHSDSEERTDAAGGIFTAGDGKCPVFEGKGLVCVKGGNENKIVCHSHLSCGNGRTLESISFIKRAR